MQTFYSGPDLLHCSGDAASSKKCGLMGGLLGSLTFDKLAFPVRKGSSSVSVDLQLNPFIPAALAQTVTKVTATSKSGDKLFCMQVFTGQAKEVDASSAKMIHVKGSQNAEQNSAEPQFIEVGWLHKGSKCSQVAQGYSAITDVSTCIAAANFVNPQTGPVRDCWGKSWKDCLKADYSEVHPSGCSFQFSYDFQSLVFNPNPNPKHVGKDKKSCGYDSLCQKTSTQSDTVAINPQEEKYSLRNMTALIV